MINKRLSVQQYFVFFISFLLLFIIQNTVAKTAYAQVYTANLTNQKQISPNTGTATLTLVHGGPIANFNFSFSGLLGTEVSAYIHGPTSPVSADVVQFIIPLGSPINNYTITLTAQQLQWLQQELLYVDIRSNIYPDPDGEIRDQLVLKRNPTSMPTAIPTITPTPSTEEDTITSTPTSAASGHTMITASACLHGFGNCGDNVSPNNGGNTTPQHQQKQITISAFNNNNQLVSTQQGMLTYNADTGIFSGNIDMGTLSSGNYLIKEKTNGFLSTQIPGIVKITDSSNNTLSTIPESIGDINNDNQLDILDYNAILNCYGTKQNTPTCANSPTEQTAGADINDDSLVNGADYNLLLREISVQKGQ